MKLSTHTARKGFIARMALGLLCLQFAGCSGLDALDISKGNGYKITKTKSAYWHPSSSIEYKSHELLVKEYRAWLRNRMAPAAEIENAAQRMPLGGRVIVRINRNTVGAANTDNFQYVVAREGEEIKRVQGQWSVPNVPSTAGGFWWNRDSVNIDQPFDNELTFYVIDDLSESRDMFVIRKPVKK